jgi:hypothetical protein
MNRFLKTTVLSLAVAATTMTAIPAATAGGRWHDNDSGDAIAAGVIGLATGAIIGGLVAQPRYYGEPAYVDDYPRPAPRRYYYSERYYEPERVYVRRSYGLEPWSRDWYRYCSSRYRSFDPSTGTFVGYDGREHFCAAN